MRSKLNKSGGPTRGGVRGPVQGTPNPWTDRQVDMSIWCYIYLIFLPCWATCPTASCISCAINPMIPKITNPAKNEVPQLPIDTTSASLKMTKENNSKFLVPHHLIGPWQFCTLKWPLLLLRRRTVLRLPTCVPAKNLVSGNWFRTLTPRRKLTQYY